MKYTMTRHNFIDMMKAQLFIKTIEWNIMIKSSQIIECAEELGYVLEPADADDVLSGSFEGETVYGAVTDWLNAFETCADFDSSKYKNIKIKWELLK